MYAIAIRWPSQTHYMYIIQSFDYLTSYYVSCLCSAFIQTNCVCTNPPTNAQTKITQKFIFYGGSPGIVVMGDDSCSRGRGFKYHHRILDRHFVTLISSMNCTFAWKDIENNRKRGRGWPIKKRGRETHIREARERNELKAHRCVPQPPAQFRSNRNLPNKFNWKKFVSKLVST